MAGRPSIADIGTRPRGKALVDATNVRFVYVQPCAAHHALRRMSPQMAHDVSPPFARGRSTQEADEISKPDPVHPLVHPMSADRRTSWGQVLYLRDPRP